MEDQKEFLLSMIINKYLKNIYKLNDIIWFNTKFSEIKSLKICDNLYVVGS